MKRLILVAMVAAAMAVAPKAEAALITGGITITGDATPGGGSNWGNATGVVFGSPITVANTNGDYLTEGVPLGTNVAFQNFTFNPVLSPNPVNPLWTFNYNGKTFSFTMVSVIVVSQSAPLPGFSFLVLTGTGLLNITGYTPTPGRFSFSGDEIVSNFGFSSNYQSAPVPEPGTMVLFGTGLLGLAAIARRRLMNS